MNRHALSAFLVLALVFLLSSITASAQQPRAVPSNDSFNSAKAIKIGKAYTVPDIGAATNEAGEPMASCKSSTLIPHSVWFTFTQPAQSVIYLSTFGTRLVTDEVHGYDTVLAVYELTSPGVFTERGCNDDVSGITAAQLTFTAYGGKTYYVVAGTFSSEPYSPESSLKLTTRMLSTTIEPPNLTFETPVNGTDWKLKNGNDDQVICSNATYPSVSGICTFRFIGTAGLTTKLTQTIPFPTVFVPRKNAYLGYLYYFRVMDTASLGTTKLKIVITYSDGTPSSVQTTNLTGTAAMAGYSSHLFSIALKSSKVASIKFEVKFGSPTGTLLFDLLTYYYAADASVRGSALLPVPPAAGEKQ